MTKMTNPFMHFSTIKDYRQAAKVNHKLSDIILLIICGVLSGQIPGKALAILVKYDWAGKNHVDAHV